MLNGSVLNFSAIQTMNDWLTAFSNATAQQKPVFAFFWEADCELSQAMAADIHASAQVVDLLNQHFIVCSLDTDLEELSDIADEFEITELPVFLVMTPERELLYFDPAVEDIEDLENELRDALRRYGLFKGLREKNAALSDTFESVLAYAESLDGAWADDDETVNDYLKALPTEGFLDPYNWLIMQELAITVQSPFFARIIENLEALTDYHTEFQMVVLLKKILSDTAELASQMNSERLLNEGIAAIVPVLRDRYGAIAPAVGIDPLLVELTTRMDYLLENGDMEAISRLASEWLDTPDQERKELVARTLSVKAVEYELPELLPLALSWSKTAVELNPVFDNEMIYGILTASESDPAAVVTYFEELMDKYRDEPHLTEILSKTLSMFRDL